MGEGRGEAFFGGGAEGAVRSLRRWLVFFSVFSVFSVHSVPTVCLNLLVQSYKIIQRLPNNRAKKSEKSDESGFR